MGWKESLEQDRYQVSLGESRLPRGRAIEPAAGNHGKGSSAVIAVLLAIVAVSAGVLAVIGTNMILGRFPGASYVGVAFDAQREFRLGVKAYMLFGSAGGSGAIDVAGLTGTIFFEYTSHGVVENQTVSEFHGSFYQLAGPVSSVSGRVLPGEEYLSGVMSLHTGDVALQLTVPSQEQALLSAPELQPMMQWQGVPDYQAALQAWNAQTSSSLPVAPPGANGTVSDVPVPEAITPSGYVAYQKFGEVAVTMTKEGSNSLVEDSPHPVPNSYYASQLLNFEAIWAPSRLAVHFVKIDTESSYDFVWIGRGSGAAVSTKYTGLYQGLWVNSNWGYSEYPQVFIQTDSSVQSWGYEIDQASGVWANPSPYTCSVYTVTSAWSANTCPVGIQLTTIPDYNTYGYGYTNNEDRRYSIYARGAGAIALHFSKLDMGSGDTISIIAENGATDTSIPQVSSGYTTSFYTGSSVTLRLSSDSSGLGSGFVVDKVYIRWGFGSVFAGPGPKDPQGARGYFFTGLGMRYDNDLSTAVEMDTNSAGKLVKQFAYSPEIASVNALRYVKDVTFQIVVGEGAGPIATDGNAYRDDAGTLMVSGTSGWTAQFGAYVGLGYSYGPFQASVGITFTPTSPGVGVQFTQGHYEGYVNIPVNTDTSPDTGIGRSASRAIGLTWKLLASTGTDGWYGFRTATKLHWTQLACGRICVMSDYYEYNSGVAKFSNLAGTTTGWVTGQLFYGSSSSSFSNRDIMLSDFTMTGWRDQYTSSNGWQEMDSRTPYFKTTDAGSDAVAWIRVKGPMAASHSVVFTYYVLVSGNWQAFTPTDSTWTTPINPPGGYYQPSATWVWSPSPTLGSYKVDVTIDGKLAAEMTFYLASS